MISRRRLLQTSAVLLPVLRAAAAEKYSLGYASITWGANLEKAFDDISATGFSGVQFRSPEWDKFKDDPAGFEALLAPRKLACVSMSSGTVGLEDEKRDEERHLKPTQSKEPEVKRQRG